MCKNVDSILLSTRKSLEQVPQRSECRGASSMRAAGRLARRLLSLHHVPPQQFARCQWQLASKSRAYLIYRWTLLIALLSTAITSFARQEIYPANPNIQLNYFKWFIYLTNWGFMLCVIQAALALAVVLRSWGERSLSISCESGGSESLELDEGTSSSERSWRGRTPLLCRVYWLAHTVATDLAFVISLIYWLVVHDPAIHKLNVLNVLVHGCNSLVMLLEVLVTSHPVRPCHALYTIALGTLYGAFSGVYQLAGGTGRAGEPAIYPALDWRRPSTALAFVAVCAAVMCAAHALAALLACARARLGARYLTARAPPPPPAAHRDKLSARVSLE